MTTTQRVTITCPTCGGDRVMTRCDGSRACYEGACGHTTWHPCPECDAAGTVEVAAELVEPQPVYACPWCAADAYRCTASDHGSVDGPAMHCRRFPSHNEFHPDAFPRWSRR